MELTSGLETPPIFREWAGKSLIAGALERRVFTNVKPGVKTFANSYIILVGDPAIGKSICLSHVEGLWRDTGVLHLAPQAVSGAALIDCLKDALCARPNVGTFHSLQIAASELALLCPAHDVSFMANMSHIYDCPPEYKENKRKFNGEPIHFPLPQLNMLACVTPGTLSSLFPPAMWEQGLASRFILVYGYEKVRVKLFEELALSETLLADIRHDLALVTQMHGQMQWEPDAKAHMQALSDGEMDKTEVQNVRMKGYNGRRFAHLIKNTMVRCASEGEDMIIKDAHLEKELDSMFFNEDRLHDVVKDMERGTHSDIMDKVHSFCLTQYAKNNRQPLPEHVLTRYISNLVSSFQVKSVLEVMISSGRLEKVEQEAAGVKTPNGWVRYAPRLMTEE